MTPLEVSKNVDVTFIRHPAANCSEAWEFRKMCPEGSVFPNAFLVYDIDDDLKDEFVIGTTEGQLLVMMPDHRQPLYSAVVAATISVILYTPKRRLLVVVTLEGQCELREGPTEAQLGKPPSHHRASCSPPAGGSGLVQQRLGGRGPHSLSRTPQAAAGIASEGSAEPAALPVVSRITIPANCTCGDLDAEGRLLFLGSSDRRVYVYNMEQGACIGSVFLQSQVFSVRSVCIACEMPPLLLIGSTTDLVLLDADEQAIAQWDAKRIDVESAHEFTGTDDDTAAPVLRPPWVFRLQRDSERDVSNASTNLLLGERNAFTRRFRTTAAAAQTAVAPRSSGSISEPSQRAVRLPLAVDWLLSSSGRAQVACVTEDGYLFLFHLWVDGKCIEDPSADVIRLGRDKPKLFMANLLRHHSNAPSIRFFRSMILHVVLVQLPGDRKTAVVALAADGSCFVFDPSTRSCCVTQLRRDVCAFSAQHRSDDALAFVCISVDEIVEYQILYADPSEPLGTVLPPWEDDEYELLLRVGRTLFPELDDPSEIVKRTEIFCAHGLSEGDWATVNSLAIADDVTI